MKQFIIRYWIEALFATITSAGAVYIRKICKKAQQDKLEDQLIKQALLVILHDRLYQQCEHLLDRGFMYDEDCDNLKLLYDAYHAMGGNGTGTLLYERTIKLKIKIRR